LNWESVALCVFDSLKKTGSLDHLIRNQTQIALYEFDSLKWTVYKSHSLRNLKQSVFE